MVQKTLEDRQRDRQKEGTKRERDEERQRETEKDRVSVYVDVKYLSRPIKFSENDCYGNTNY